MNIIYTFSNRIKIVWYTVALFSLFWLPMVVSATTTVGVPDPKFGNVTGFVSNIIKFISNVLVPLVFALALLLFLWGMFVYFIAGGGDEGKRAQGKGLMIWAVIALVVMVIIWAIVNLFANGLVAGMGSDRDALDSFPSVIVN